jgi:5-hydroxyisourate hydrolase-like protein (transthyretin family)
MRLVRIGIWRTSTWIAVVMALVVALSWNSTPATASPQATSSQLPEDVSSVPQAQGQSNKTNFTIRGTVKLPADKTIPAATIVVVAFKLGEAQSQVLGETQSDELGRFSLALQDFDSQTYQLPYLMARQDGCAFAFQNMSLEEGVQEFEFNLEREQLLTLKLVDLQGQPLAGVSMQISMIGTTSIDSASYFADWKRPPHDRWSMLTSDESGTLKISHLASHHGIVLNVLGDERVAPQMISINTGLPEARPEDDRTFRGVVRNIAPNEVGVIPLVPAQYFEGQVLLGDSNKPAVNSRVEVWSSEQYPVGSMISKFGKTDGQGRFRICPHAGLTFGIVAYAPKNEPYLNRQMGDLTWEPGDASKRIVIRLPPCPIATGRVVDAVTQKPIRGATVQYLPSNQDPAAEDDMVTGWQTVRRTDRNGEYTIAVAKGKGTLLVHAPKNSNYILKGMSQGELSEDRPSGWRLYAHAFQPLSIDTDHRKELPPIPLELGGQVQVRLVDPDGAPVKEFIHTSKLDIEYHSPEWNAKNSNWGFEKGHLATIRGVPSDESAPIYFLDPKRKLGAVAHVTRNDPTPTVTLSACGKAIVKIVDEEGNPMNDAPWIAMMMVMTDGPRKYDEQARDQGLIWADEDFVSNFDRTNHSSNAKPNEQGIMTFDALIPGALYRLSDTSKMNEPGFATFSVKSGETKDFGVLTTRASLRE